MANLLVRIGLNSAGFKTGLAQCRMAAGNFKKSVGGMFSGIGSQILGALGVSAGIAGISALTQKTIEFGGTLRLWQTSFEWAKANFNRLPTPQNLRALKSRSSFRLCKLSTSARLTPATATTHIATR